ncbi:MAG TPA: hypothetical protein VLH75_05925 [Longimicrobiales bacterium]|nr:hypothetical protein [Longimicrobiales bacterium]
MFTVVLVAVTILLFLGVGVVLWLRSGVREFGASLEGVVQGIVQLRGMAGASPQYAPVPEDAPEATGLARAEPDLERADLHPVGDLFEVGRDGKPAAAVRWFVSGDGGVFGWLGLSPAGPAMLLISEIPEVGFVTTLRGPDTPSTAAPPTVVHERLAWDEGLDAALTRHQDGVARMGEPLAVEGLEGALEGMDALKAHVAEWRAAQDPAELLEADVRKILGVRFEDLGGAVVALVRVAEGEAAREGGAPT